ncbi:MAG: DDE-type integrase/transposase/recombinase [Armatimonadota bacterium]|nr:DDE-type integrase/transposase/recombinase [Armatimonadota bacterium]
MSLDAFSIGNLKGVGKVWQLTACDAACSYALATIVPRVTVQSAIRFLREHVVPAYRRAGHPIRAVLTDGGPEWSAAFTRACQALGIQHRRTTPRHAWTNGFVERLQGTILTELWRVAFRRTYDTSLDQLDRDLVGLPALLQLRAPASGLPPQGAHAGIRVSQPVSRLSHDGLGWSDKMQTPGPHWTNRLLGPSGSRSDRQSRARRG